MPGTKKRGGRVRKPSITLAYAPADLELRILEPLDWSWKTLARHLRDQAIDVTDVTLARWARGVDGGPPLFTWQTIDRALIHLMARKLR